MMDIISTKLNVYEAFDIGLITESEKQSLLDVLESEEVVVLEKRGKYKKRRENREKRASEEDHGKSLPAVVPQANLKNSTDANDYVLKEYIKSKKATPAENKRASTSAAETRKNEVAPTKSTGAMTVDELNEYIKLGKFEIGALAAGSGASAAVAIKSVSDLVKIKKMIQSIENEIDEEKNKKKPDIEKLNKLHESLNVLKKKKVISMTGSALGTIGAIAAGTGAVVGAVGVKGKK